MLRTAKSKNLNIRAPQIIIGLFIVAAIWLLAEYLAGAAEFHRLIDLPQDAAHSIAIDCYIPGTDRSLDISSPEEQRAILSAVRSLKYGGITRRSVISPEYQAYGLRIYGPDGPPLIITLANDQYPSNLGSQRRGLKISNPAELYRLVQEIYQTN